MDQVIPEEAEVVATVSGRPVAQATAVRFELHTLGWEAFQNLSGLVLREILGQAYTVFSATNDAGQDGAFQGTWSPTGEESYTGRFVVQCKFTCRPDSHLSLSNLKDELEKAERLAEAGHASTYLLITNAKVSGVSVIKVREAFLAIPEIEHFDIFGEEWLTEQIRESRRLRALVPRLYGLGDLSQILDERVYRQANELLQSWKDNLTKFVPTAAHRKSFEALQSKGFVLLLGDPMAGKSTISAALALAAADTWGCVPVFATEPSDFKNHWNPDEPKQFFWIDDAFGQTQYNGALAEGWNRMFPLLASAIKKGARVIFTSRTNIFNAAKRDLKSSSFPLIGDSQVVVEVEKLGLPEKERILYNHLRMGEQPSEFRTKVKPYLQAVAEHPEFLPEIARRLGNPVFTKKLIISESRLAAFVDSPRELLEDVIRELGKADFAALALIFMRSGQASIPLGLEENERTSLAVIDGNLANICDALDALDGVLVKKSLDTGSFSWKFSHPTIREAIASVISEKVDLLDIYLAGVKASEIVRECACGVSEMGGAKIFVPVSRFPKVLEKLDVADTNAFIFDYYFFQFLGKRCSDEFLNVWVNAAGSSHAYFFESSNRSAGNYGYCSVLIKLKELGLLDEKQREGFLDCVRDVLESELDVTALDDDFSDLMSLQEREMILVYLKNDVLPLAYERVQEREDLFDSGSDDVEDYFYELDAKFEGLGVLFEDDGDAVECIEACANAIFIAKNNIKAKALEEGYSQWQYDDDGNLISMGEASEVEGQGATESRSLFDDVDK
tara:strand:+ start:5003 stop:7366 length:2364 start_codon:yes stop_codon:yes gene_type:complete